MWYKHAPLSHTYLADNIRCIFDFHFIILCYCSYWHFTLNPKKEQTAYSVAQRTEIDRSTVLVGWNSAWVWYFIFLLFFLFCFLHFFCLYFFIFRLTSTIAFECPDLELSETSPIPLNPPVGFFRGIQNLV